MSNLRGVFRLGANDSKFVRRERALMGRKTSASTWDFDAEGGQGYKLITITTAGGGVTVTPAFNRAGAQDIGDLPIDVDKFQDGRYEIAGTRYEGEFGTYAEPVIADYQTAAAQSIPTSSSTVVDYDTAVIDNYSAVTPGASWVFTAPIPGNYAVIAYTEFSSVPTNSRIDLFVNAANRARIAWGLQTQMLGRTVALAAGDQIDIRLRHTTGGAITLTANGNKNYISIMQIR